MKAVGLILKRDMGMDNEDLTAAPDRSLLTRVLAIPLWNRLTTDIVEIQVARFNEMFPISLEGRYHSDCFEIQAPG